MPYKEISKNHLAFFRRGGAGCLFAAIAAGKPSAMGWATAVCCKPYAFHIENILSYFKRHDNVSTLSVVFPTITTVPALALLARELETCDGMLVEQSERHGRRCLGFRVNVGGKQSWVAGFGPFAHFPATRRAPYTSIVLRVKDKPKYIKEIDETPDGTLHVANMHIRGMGEHIFVRTNEQSYINTAKILGHKPDIFSAAKTTFSFPEDFFSQAI
ncbi:hypothetical protein [Shinella zoogloeoides]